MNLNFEHKMNIKLGQRRDNEIKKVNVSVSHTTTLYGPFDRNRCIGMCEVRGEELYSEARIIAKNTTNKLTNANK